MRSRAVFKCLGKMHKEATSTQQACLKTNAKENNIVFYLEKTILALPLLLTGPSSTCTGPDMTPEDRD